MSNDLERTFSSMINVHPECDLFRSVGGIIVIPTKPQPWLDNYISGQLLQVGRLVRVRDVEALERLQFLTSQNRELNEQNETLTQDRLLLLQSNGSLEIRLKRIQQELCLELEGRGSYADGSATPYLLQSTLETVHVKVSGLAKVFVDLMKSYGLDHELALVTHYKGIYLTRRAHVNFMLKAWIYSVLFANFENESFLSGGPRQFLNSNDRKLESFDYFHRILSNADSTADYFASDCAFRTFCHKKFLCFFALWQSFRLHITDDLSMASVEALEPRTRKLIQGFMSVAQIVWAIHKLSLSFEPCAGIFRVKRGSEFKEDYMSSVVSKDEDPKFVSEVGFMISPGFCIRKSVVKCQIYLAGC